MARLRKPFQGVLNIIRFNWHFYVLALALILGLSGLASFFESPVNTLLLVSAVLISLSTLISLLASMYAYDFSGLYDLQWIDEQKAVQVIVNINAGFDETSVLLKEQFKKAKLITLDFYDPQKHTEVSIKRARKAYPPYPGTKRIQTDKLELAEASADIIFITLAAHEIRDEAERLLFFKELRKTLKPQGKIYVTEHLRDTANFLTYNIGFFHFYSKKSWLKIFSEAELKVEKELKITGLISVFVLK